MSQHKKRQKLKHEITKAVTEAIDDSRHVIAIIQLNASDIQMLATEPDADVIFDVLSRMSREMAPYPEAEMFNRN